MNKPLALKKIKKFSTFLRKNDGEIGTAPKAIIINFNNRCNFRCKFCYEHSSQRQYGNIHLNYDELADFADQADELGYFDITIQGGELLIDTESLYRLVECLKPERFEITLVTNGLLMTQEIADHLAEIGVDVVGVSLSTLNAKEHDESRGVNGSHEKAMNALKYVENAGMIVWPNAIFGHDNAQTPELEQFLKTMDEKGYLTFFNLAMPFGEWNQNEDVILTKQDIEKLNHFRKKYKCCVDFWNQYDVKKEKNVGCNTVNRLYLTPLGDVMPCPYIHVKLGNIKEQSLKEIVDYGFSIKWFRNHSDICLAAQNMEFRDKYLKEERDIFSPLDAHEIFSEEDYIKNAE
jgi:MoaA/NifB/PqqE/SkfB family radical SAM enzyme